MKTVFLAATLIITSLSAHAAGVSSRCTEPALLKEVEAYFNTKVNSPESVFVGSCLTQEIRKSILADQKAGKNPSVGEAYFDKVAQSVLARIQQADEAAKWKAEVFEKQMDEVNFPPFLDQEADLKRANPLEGTEE